MKYFFAFMQNKEKYAKLCIVVEEADETQFWLEIIEELEYFLLKIFKF